MTTQLSLTPDQLKQLNEITSNGTANFADGYRYISGIIQNNPAVDADTKFFFKGAADVNANVAGSDTNVFIHSVIAAGLAWDGELDLGAGIATNQLWLQHSGNDLAIEVMGTHDRINISGWFSSAAAQLQEIKTADGSELDSGLGQLVSAMATYSAQHPDFDPFGVGQIPNDAALQSALAAAWHH